MIKIAIVISILALSAYKIIGVNRKESLYSKLPKKYKNMYGIDDILEISKEKNMFRLFVKHGLNGGKEIFVSTINNQK